VFSILPKIFEYALQFSETLIQLTGSFLNEVLEFLEKNFVSEKLLNSSIGTFRHSNNTYYTMQQKKGLIWVNFFGKKFQNIFDGVGLVAT